MVPPEGKNLKRIERKVFYAAEQVTDNSDMKKINNRDNSNR